MKRKQEQNFNFDDETAKTKKSFLFNDSKKVNFSQRNMAKQKTTFLFQTQARKFHQ